jgi:hypothetical protein
LFELARIRLTEYFTVLKFYQAPYVVVSDWSVPLAFRSLSLGRSPRRSPSFDRDDAAHILAHRVAVSPLICSLTGGDCSSRRVSSCCSAPILLPFVGCTDGALADVLALRTVLSIRPSRWFSVWWSSAGSPLNPSQDVFCLLRTIYPDGILSLIARFSRQTLHG